MKAKISVKGMSSTLAELRHLAGGGARSALVDALDHTANQARQALRSEMSNVFDNPSPWVTNSIFMQSATPQHLEAALWVKENKVGRTDKSFADWMAPQVDGGKRLHKGSEKLLREAGMLPAGRFIVPGAGARLDAAGNFSRGQIVQIISGLRAFKGDAARINATNGKRSRQKGNARAFFVLYRGKTPIGIAERRGERMAVVLAFVGQPKYRARFKFHDVVQRVVDARFTANLDKAVAKVLSRQR